MIKLTPGAANQLLLNPRWSDSEKAVLRELQTAFETIFGAANYILIGSSGSSRSENESIKLIALKIESILSSAKRVNQYLRAGPDDHWALVLPEFHIAGVGVRARAHLAGAQVHSFSWDLKTIKSHLQQNSISFMSVVPAQLYDLVVAGVESPNHLKKLIVGGGALQPRLKKEAQELGWPVVETYGMTETASMIAVREANDYFQLLTGVSASLNQSGYLQISCDSLLSATIQKKGNEISVAAQTSPEDFTTQDLAEILPDRSIKLLGRGSEYIKILGEGVSLAELRACSERLASAIGIGSMLQFEIMALEHERRGYEIVLVVEELLGNELAERLFQTFNREVRPYEKLTKVITVHQIPRTELGKLKSNELKRIINL